MSPRPARVIEDRRNRRPFQQIVLARAGGNDFLTEQ